MKFLRDITEFIFLEDLPEKADLIIVPGNTWPLQGELRHYIMREWHLISLCPAGTAKGSRRLREQPAKVIATKELI